MKFYKCPMCCNKGFTSQQDLKEHLIKAAQSIKCPACYKSFKNLLYLIKHLDQCTATEENQSPSKDYSEFSGTGVNLDLTFDNDDEDDVEGYFCTVCDVKIPEVNEHVEKFHFGQEVILQDDDDDDDEEDTECSASSDAQYSCSSDNKRICTGKRKLDEFVNGTDVPDMKPKVTSSKEEEEPENSELFYCPQCELSFQSLSEHTSTYHSNLDVLVKDISIHELFSASRQNNGSFVYFCSCCQKSIVRKRTLAKHLKLCTSSKDDKLKLNKHHSNSSNKKIKSSSLQNYNSSPLENSYRVKDETDGDRMEPSSVYEIEEVKPDLYDFEDLGHSIFNT